MLPLNAIIGFSDLINDSVPFEDLLNFNESINASGNHLLNIVEDIFDVTWIESGQIRVHETEDDLSKILKSVLKDAKKEQKIVGKIGLQLYLKEFDINGIKIKTDIPKLKQVLLNLMKNAIKFTHKGHIEFAYTVEEFDSKTVLKFYVEDTGIGIPDDKYDQIFELFRQIEDANTRVYGGTGIG